MGKCVLIFESMFRIPYDNIFIHQEIQDNAKIVI